MAWMNYLLLLLIIIAFTLACAAAVEFYYLLFLQTANRQHKRRIAELEREKLRLSRALDATGSRLRHELARRNREEWPEVVGEDDDYSVG